MVIKINPYNYFKIYAFALKSDSANLGVVLCSDSLNRADIWEKVKKRPSSPTLLSQKGKFDTGQQAGPAGQGTTGMEVLGYKQGRLWQCLFPEER